MKIAFITALTFYLALAGFAAAQESLDGRVLPVGVYNIAAPDFGLNMGGATYVDLGYVSDEPIRMEDEPDSYGQGGDPTQFDTSLGEDSVKIFIFRTPRPLYMNHHQTIVFRVRVGEIFRLRCWPESYASTAVWAFRIVQVEEDGTRDTLYVGAIPSNTHKWVPVNPYSTIEFSITLQRWDKEMHRRLWVTVSPERLYEDHLGRVIPRGAFDWP